ncbi:hypothetical protein WICMUC_003163 [Wickerhamomyces mucosus]|uniref:Autophagy-related protein 101 n=1 Tax=Wickerhamomyces mucosus TaxID=1378264 RepID=A0A9P8PMI2_9ASCO|nr:hypothetical protein WICMUC_003163 [Wickerhamomyces mucosus]
MKQLKIIIHSDRSNISEYLNSLLQFIFFQRSYGSITPQVSQFLNVSYPCLTFDDGNEELKKLNYDIDEVIKEVIESKNLNDKGELSISFWELKNNSNSIASKISTWSNFFNDNTSTSNSTENLELSQNINLFEQFLIEVNILNDDESFIIEEFERNLDVINEWCIQNKEHIPNLTNLNILPFNFNLSFKVDSGEKNHNSNDIDWKSFIKKILK